MNESENGSFEYSRLMSIIIFIGSHLSLIIGMRKYWWGFTAVGNARLLRYKSSWESFKVFFFSLLLCVFFYCGKIYLMHNIKCTTLIIRKVHNIKYTVTVSLVTTFCKHHHYPITELFCAPKQKLCIYQTITSYSPSP